MHWQHIHELMQQEMASGIVTNTLVRLAVAAILGGAIGLERELRHKPSGLRTNMAITHEFPRRSSRVLVLLAQAPFCTRAG